MFSSGGGKHKTNLNYAFLKPEKYDPGNANNCKPASPIRFGATHFR